ncbi:MAG: sulfatase-like hydrolase/transferase [Bryobacteraceae bacterium]|nr:sulfatase-like hydrolase/transferase [Bryobacteraceae bacterium]
MRAFPRLPDDRPPHRPLPRPRQCRPRRPSPSRGHHCHGTPEKGRLLTALYGKWSLGGLGTAGYPTRRGFDDWFGFFSQVHAHTYYPEHLLENDREFLVSGNFGAKKTTYAPDLFTRRALDFINKNPDPFFLHLCYTIPHANNEVGRDTGNGMEVPDDAPYKGKSWPQQERNFAAMITRMDRDIGRLLAALKQNGQAENTLVLFTSDNGPHQEGGHDPAFFKSTGPLRGIKRDLYEGGIRVPGLAWWPGRVQPAQVSNHPWAFWDFLPTACDLAGIDAPSNLDGLSFAPALFGKPAKQHEYFYWEFHERGFHQAVRMGDWKGVRLGSREPIELYNLAKDVGEAENVAARHPDIVRRIEAILAQARTDSQLFPIKEAPESANP